MKTAKKAMLMTLCAIILVVATVFGTMAYLTASDEVINTFTVGNVAIKLDEVPVDANGKATAGDRVQANSYKLLPGLTYDKDPMVTVLANSEESYVKMTVTVNNANELDDIFDPSGANLLAIFGGYDADNWTYKGNTTDAANNRTYEFWYKETVSAGAADVALDALFDTITVPGEITKEQLSTLSDLKITVNAHAIQADGFANADEAWAAFTA